MTVRRNSRGFTLVELMIVIAILGLLAGIATPNFLKAWGIAKVKAAVETLQQIEAAKEIWAMDTFANQTATPTWGVLAPAYMRRKPDGPGTFTINSLDTNPSSTIPGADEQAFGS